MSAFVHTGQAVGWYRCDGKDCPVCGSMPSDIWMKLLAAQPPATRPAPQCNGPFGDEEACPVHGAEIRAARYGKPSAPAPAVAPQESMSELIAEMKSYTDRHNLMEDDFLYAVGLMRRAYLAAPAGEASLREARPTYCSADEICQHECPVNEPLARLDELKDAVVALCDPEFTVEERKAYISNRSRQLRALATQPQREKGEK